MADTILGSTSTTSSLNINSSVTSSIDFVGDTDWWRVNLPVGYGYQVWLEGSQYGKGTLADPYLAIYNSAGTLQLYNNNYSTYVYDAYLSATPSSTGIFYLSAEEFGNNGTGSYTITIWQDQLASVSTAATVPVNGSVEGRVGWQDDIADWYAVSLTAGIMYQFDLTGAANDGALSGLTLVDPYLALRGSTGTLLLSDDDSGLGLNSRIFFTPSTSGTYFVDAQESGNNATGIYRLTVNSAPTVGVLTLGTPRTGSVDFAGDVDLYSVALTAGVTYAFAIDGNTLSDPYLEVLDSRGDTQDSDDDSGSGLNAYLTFTPTTSGTYYLSARESGNNATGSYTASVSKIPTVSIVDAYVTEGDTGTTNLVFTLTLSSSSSIPVAVTAGTSGTATATTGIDYIPTSNSITFAPGQTAATFTVQVRGDTVFEPTESLHVLLSNPIGAILGDSNAYGIIRDNDNPYSLPSDTYADLEWYLYPTTGINVFPVWNDYTGVGVRVAVFDQGIDPNHPDLNDNLLYSLGRNASNLTSGGSPILSGDNHGTMVAGTIAAERNGIGVVGVAYGASLVSIYSPLALNGLGAQIANAYTYAINADVLNDSWGFANGFSNGSTWAFYDNFQGPLFSAAGTALANLAATGRNGLGTVVVQSAGNSFSVGDDTNLHNFQNSQYIITVAATDYAGNVTSYSSPGASILVAAPGGGSTDDLSNIVTTDRVGAAGNNSGGDYTTTAGTSFSAPIVSGVVALMLEANPHLGYRDVQEIIAYSAREISSASNTWLYNGASNWNGGGLHYDALDHNFGYGLVDARAAVRLAETWTSTPHTAANRQQVSINHNTALAIPDNTGLGAFDSIIVSQAIDIERVEVSLNVTHPYIGDLSVLLTSPSGTTSFLIWRPQKNSLSAYGSSQDNIHFTLDTVLDWGESSIGNWTIGVFDYASYSVGTFDSWTLNLIGKPASADDVYIYTDEFAQACLDQPSRSTLTDTGGIDTINAAACGMDLLLNLNAGSVSSINGRSFTISTGTIIENAFGGDGDDNISGNDVSNVLSGGRGNDILDGGGGIDTALYIGVRADYVITSISNGFRVISSKEGTDILTNVEFAQFSDKTIALTVPDTTPPTVSTFSPTDEDINVAIANNIVVTFNEAIIRGTGDILLKNAAGTIIETYNAATSINLSISGSTLTINPTTNLSYSTGYRVEFASSTIKDLAGNSYTGTTDYNFTTIPFVNTAPTGSVTITGNATQNQTLTAANTLADVDGLGAISYQWKAGDTNISGATANTYALSQAEVGKTITVVASYTDGQGTVESKTSTATAAVLNINDLPTGSVTITGTTTQGQTLTASNTLADADGLGVIGYQWQAGGTNISGATTSNYILTQAEVGKSITVVASYIDGGNTAESKTSTTTTTVEAAAAPIIPTKAKIFMESGDSNFTISNGGTTLYGNAGNNNVTIAAGVTDVILDQNIERIKFSGESSSYTFKQTGNMINVYDASGLIVKAPVQGDSDGTLLSFSNCTASTKLSGGVMTLGGTAVSSVTTGGVTPLTTITEPSTTNVTNAKVFLGAGNDSFTVSSIGTTIYGNTGNDIVTIADGVTGVTLDQNIERINFTGASSSYAFKQTGNLINVYDASNITLLLAKAPVQGDTDGTLLSFSDGIADAHLTGGVMTLSGTPVSAGAATPLTLVGLAAADIGL